jgi:hypothetical protein
MNCNFLFFLIGFRCGPNTLGIPSARDLNKKVGVDDRLKEIRAKGRLSGRGSMLEVAKLERESVRKGSGRGSMLNVPELER